MGNNQFSTNCIRTLDKHNQQVNTGYHSINNQNGPGRPRNLSNKVQDNLQEDSLSDTSLNFDPKDLDMININQSMNESVVTELDKLNQFLGNINPRVYTR